jgi:hypothetical protein
VYPLHRYSCLVDWHSYWSLKCPAPLCAPADPARCSKFSPRHHFHFGWIRCTQKGAVSLLAPLAAGLACRHRVGLRFNPVQKTPSQWLLPIVFLKCLVSRVCRTLPKPCGMFERPFLGFWRTLCLRALYLFELGVSDNSCSSRFLSALVASLRAAVYA